MLLQYPVFYRKFGIRLAQHLISPRLFKVEDFRFPLNSTLHYVSHSETDLTPDQNQAHFAFFKNKRIGMDIVGALQSEEGNPRKTSLQVIQVARKFFQKNRLFRFVKDVNTVIKDPNALTVLDYGYLTKLYRYSKTPLTPYHEWINIERTAWKNIADTAVKSERHNFIFYEVPDVLPSVNTLRQFSKKLSSNFNHFFDTPEKKFLLELWKWIDVEDREKSILNAIPVDQLGKVNIVFTFKGLWCVLNLQQLENWRKSSEDKDSEIDKPTHTQQYNPQQLQKLILKLCIGVQSGVMPVTDETIPNNIQNTEPVNNGEGSDTDAAIDPDEEDADTPIGNRVDIEQPTLQKHEDLETLERELENENTSGDILSEVDKELEVLETIEKRYLLARVSNTNISVPSEVEDVFKPLSFETNTTELEEIHSSIYREKTAEEVLKDTIDRHSEYGLMSAADYRNLVKQADKFMASPNPHDGRTPIKDFIKVDPEKLSIKHEEIQLAERKTVADKSMLVSSLNAFDSKYIKEVMGKDISAMAVNIQRAGIVLQSYEVETHDSILGAFEVHTLKVKPIDGAPSTIRFKIPKVDEEGNFVANGNKYHMRKQRGDLPIRKINPFTVALTSYYGKVFIARSIKKVNDSIDWLANKILILGQTGESKFISNVAPADVFDNEFKSPRIYSGLSRYFRSFDAQNYHLVFDRIECLKLGNETEIVNLEGDKRRCVGVDKSNNLVFVDYDENFFVYVENQFKPIGNIFTLTMLDQTKAPIDFAEIKILGKTIPVGIVLAYILGLTNLIKLLRIKPRVVEGKQRVELSPDEWVIAFKDKKYVFSKKDKLATMILGGFGEYWKSIKNYFAESFDKRNVYLNVLETNGIGARFLRELDLLDQLFIDPITRDILREMNEPLTFFGLVIRGSELLLNDQHPASQDMRAMRIKGYERFAGAAYREVVTAIRDFKSRNIRGKSQIDMSLYAVWRAITQDSSVEIVKDINPIENLKQTEAVTYVGEGGRSKDAMSRATRAYHISDVGTISEATVESGDVGINAYLSANPGFASLRGLTKPYDEKVSGKAGILSTSALIAPGSDADDAKRVNFVNVQQSHTISCEGYHQPFMRTGYESVLADRTGEMFAYNAKKNGKVLSKNDRGIIIEYEDGEKKGVNLGRQYGKAEGSVYPHDIVSLLNVGDTFSKGDNIAYNTGFFEPDFLDPKSVVWRSSMSVKTVLYDSSQTHEDSSSISKNLSAKLTTKTTKVRSFVVDFKQGVKNVLKIGTRVEPETTLFIIEDEITNDLGLFDEQSLATLQKLANKAPKAKVRGVVDRIEVYYHGNKDDMSSSLRAIANQSDKELAETAKAVGKTIFTGEVTDDYRVSGTPLALDQAEIKVYVTLETSAGVGDKGVFANQMKSVFGEVMDYTMTAEDGTVIDAVFGSTSINNRIVTSPVVIGTTTTILKLIGQKAVQIFRG